MPPLNPRRNFPRFVSPFLALVGSWAHGDSRGAAPVHWAFRPVVNPAVPSLVDASRVQSPLDAFVVARLAEKGLTMSPPADRGTLIRRAHLNLTGVPPKAEEVDEFISNGSPNAFPNLVDRLLADPRFGERWARYWLDVARYADSKGYVFQEERRYAYSYVYRDWVISAFNGDLPFDKFVLAQLAADQSLGREDPKQLAAMGFLTLGRRFLNNEADIIDDRLDVTIRGLQGLTIGCARCHDHKFDPIPQADYYSLYGVFASSEEPSEKPLLSEPVRTPEYVAFESGVAKREQVIQDFYVGKKRALFQESSLEHYLQVCADGWNKPDNEFSEMAKKRNLYPAVALRWRACLQKLGDRDPVVSPWLVLVKLAPENFSAEWEAALTRLFADSLVNPLVAAALRNCAASSMADVNKCYARLMTKYRSEQAMPDADAEAVRQLVVSPDGPEGMDAKGLGRDFSLAEREEVRKLRLEVERFRATSENAPARGMVMVDRPQPVEPHIFQRGNRSAPGPQVPRQFLSCLDPQRQPFKQGSGRLELAEVIAAKDNPLTARVFVNRVWGWLTGQPLVDTPSDFGVRTAPPANPELLDFLAGSFVENGWSVKRLVREILLSSTWQQSSSEREPGGSTPAASPRSVDPDNKLLWKMNRRRRDFESFRDSLLAVAGRLDGKLGGRAVDIDNAAARRRTIYGFIDRQNLPALFRAFDFASPDQHSPKRFQTTVPQQALFALNNPFVVEQARALAAIPAASDEERVLKIYRAVLSRAPESDELKNAVAFIKAGPIGQSAGAWEYGWGGFDEATGKTDFHPFPYFGHDRWSGSEQLPDPQLGWVTLTRDGGHPGADPTHAVILRWRAPENMIVRVEAELKRPAGEGDGVRLRVVTNIQGARGNWDASPSSPATAKIDRLELAAAEVLDFVIDCINDNGDDSFQFTPRLVDVTSGLPVAMATQEFAGPALDPWVAFSQVVLVSNEFMFVD